MRGKKLALLSAVAIVAIGVTGGAAYAGHKVYANHQACESMRDYAAQTGPVQHLGEGNTAVTVLGDSYSTGDTLADRGDAWPAQFAAQTGSRVDVVGEGGTGYVNEGFCGDGSYQHRAAAAINDPTDTVIIQGGLNDLTADGNELATAADRLIGSFNGRNVVLVGPVDAPNEHGEARVNRILHDAADRADVTYVDAIEWDVDYGPDGKHLSPAGARKFAAHLAAALS